MLIWLDRMAGLLLDASLATAALLSLVALAMIGCRQPVRRIGLARAGMLGGLAMMPLVVLAPLPRFDIAGVVRSSALGSHPLLDVSARASGDSSAPGGVSPVPPAPLAAGAFGRLVGAPTRSLFVLYAAGVASGLAWLVLGYWGLGWVTRRSEPASRACLDLYDSLPHSRRRPRLRVSDRVRRPVLVGLLRQTILIPAELDAAGNSQPLRLSLLHELAHAEHRDPWFGLASSLCQAFWFFLPPLWWIRAQMRLDQEFMADRRAAVSFGPLQSYASSLVKIASPALEARPQPTRGTPGPERPASALFQRVLMLVQCPFTVESRPPRWWGWSLPCLVLLGTMAASSLSLRVAPLPADPDRARVGRGPRAQQSFRMAKLVVNASSDPHTRSTFFELPIRLPEHFDLTLELWGDRSSLSQTRVVGRRLLPVEVATAPEPSPEQWHPVRLRRDTAGLAIWVDGRRLPPDPFVGTTTWLSVECPGDRASQVRNLVLAW